MDEDACAIKSVFVFAFGAVDIYHKRGGHSNEGRVGRRECRCYDTENEEDSNRIREIVGCKKRVDLVGFSRDSNAHLVHVDDKQHAEAEEYEVDWHKGNAE